MAINALSSLLNVTNIRNDTGRVELVLEYFLTWLFGLSLKVENLRRLIFHVRSRSRIEINGSSIAIFWLESTKTLDLDTLAACWSATTFITVCLSRLE